MSFLSVADIVILSSFSLWSFCPIGQQSVCSPFGPVDKVLILHAKQQAFVGMQSLDSAVKLVTHYTSNVCYIRTKSIFFQYSTRNEVKVNENQNFSGQAPSSNVLIVSVLNCRVPVTLENMYSIFKPYAEVQKIILFVKDSVFKALVQLRTVEQAVNSKVLLEGKDIFQGCCTLRIGFSTLTDLSVKENGPRSRDFTIPEPDMGSFPGYGGGSSYLIQQQPQGYGPYPGSMGMGGGGGMGQIGGLQNMGGMGSGMNSLQIGSGMGSMGGMQMQGMNIGGDAKGCVLLVNNLTPERTTPDTLFTLFGVYGDVLRVKILFNKRDTAMIQFASAEQAQLAQLHLNHLTLHGKQLMITISKHGEISLPRSDADPESTLLTKDFANSPIHRFKNRTGGVTKNINPPSQVLHVSSLPDNTSGAELRRIFGEEQATEPAVQFFTTNKAMAYVKMETLHDAILALIRLHNFRLRDKYIRVSFSPKDPSQVSNSDEDAGVVVD